MLHNLIFARTPSVSFTIRGKNLTKDALSSLQKDLDKTAAGFEGVRVEAKKAGDEGEEAIDGMGKSARATKSDFGGLALASGALAASIGLAVKGVLSASIQMDGMKRGLLAAAGSAAGMEAQLKRLREVAKLPGLGLPEAVRASIRLQAVKFDAEFAERSLKAVGNALASVGAGRAELDGVTLAMTQMKAKGKVSAEEINQMAERMPQVRQAMIDAFGTANTEMIQEMGMTVDEFLEGMIVQLEKLPAVTGGVGNSLENLQDSIFQLRNQFGDILLPALVKVVDKLSSVVEWVSKLSDTQKEIFAWGTVSVGAISGLVAALAGLGTALPGIISSVGALKKAVSFLITNPYGLAILGASILAGVILKMTVFKDNTLDAADAVSTLTNALSKQNEELVRTTLISAQQTIGKTKKEIQGLTDEMGKLLKEVLQRQKGGFGGFLGMTDEALREAYQKTRARRAQLLSELEVLKKTATEAELFLQGRSTRKTTPGRPTVAPTPGSPTTPFIFPGGGDEDLREKQAEETGKMWDATMSNSVDSLKEWDRMAADIGMTIAGIPIEIAKGIKEGEGLMTSFFNSIQSAISSMLNMIAVELQKIAAAKIAARILGKTQTTGGKEVFGPPAPGGGMAGGFASFAMTALSMMSFDNPVNDKQAFNMGQQAAMVSGMHFANPMNDYRARAQGMMAASKDLGERSAGDMVSHFRAGFEGKSKEMGSGGTAEVLERIESALSANANPTFQLVIDGRELEATVQRITDRREFRQSGY